MASPTEEVVWLANEENLLKGKATQFRAGEEQVRIAQQGGRTSGESRKKRKALRLVYDTVACLPYRPLGALAEEIARNFGEMSNGREMTVDEAIMMAQIVKAANGDTQAAVFIRDTVGEKNAEVIDSTVRVILQGELEDFAR